MDKLYLEAAPQLDPAWLAFEDEEAAKGPEKVFRNIVERQPVYAAQCRELQARMMAPGARDHYLASGIRLARLSVPSTLDGFDVPVFRYKLSGASRTASSTKQKLVIVYIHGGGLRVGEADSEELSCRRILKDEIVAEYNATLYSIGYRLMPQHPASTCVSDCRDAFDFVLRTHPGATVVLAGSSSGGQLAALVSQYAPKDRIHGVVLRCPVTSDVFSGKEYVPDRFRDLHSSTDHLSFCNKLLTRMVREVPRDGLPWMPLEASEDLIRGMPRTWIQICTNDALYSDGVCYAKALEEVGVDVQVNVVRGWPHTFWLKAPQLKRALEAEEAMLRGLAWILH